MKRVIALSGTTVEYDLTWKNVKNLNLRVRSDGTVSVSAHRRVGIRGVESFLRKNEAFLFRALERVASAKQKDTVEEGILRDGGRFPFLGMTYPVTVTEGTKNIAVLENDILYITVTDTESKEKIRDVICDFLEQRARTLIPSLCEELLPRFAAERIPFPIFRFRRMVSRWGSCCPAAQTVTINKFLICAPMDCIEYVVAHELAHFLVLNHSGEFYKVLQGVLPDWRQRKKKLESYGRIIRQIGSK